MVSISMLNICRTPLCPNEFKAVGAIKYCAECRKIPRKERTALRLAERMALPKEPSVDNQVKDWMLKRGNISARSSR